MGSSAGSVQSQHRVVPSGEEAAREHSLASFRSSDTHLVALSNAQLPFRARKVHSARSRSPAAVMGKDSGWEGTGNPVRDVCYSETKANLRSSYN